MVSVRQDPHSVAHSLAKDGCSVSHCLIEDDFFWSRQV